MESPHELCFYLTRYLICLLHTHPNNNLPECLKWGQLSSYGCYSSTTSLPMHISIQLLFYPIIFYCLLSYRVLIRTDKLLDLVLLADHADRTIIFLIDDEYYDKHINGPAVYSNGLQFFYIKKIKNVYQKRYVGTAEIFSLQHNNPTRWNILQSNRIQDIF